MELHYDGDVLNFHVLRPICPHENFLYECSILLRKVLSMRKLSSKTFQSELGYVSAGFVPVFRSLLNFSHLGTSASLAILLRNTQSAP